MIKQKHKQSLMKRMRLKESVDQLAEMTESYENLDLTYELVKEESDEELQAELEEEIVKLVQKMNDFELQLLLSDEYDKNNAILRVASWCGWNRVTRLGLYAASYVHKMGREKRI